MADDADGECALCLQELRDACATRCGHRFCRSCILQAMGMYAPTWIGRCPLCRQSMSVYSLVHVASGEALASPEVSTIFGSVYVQSGGLGKASYHFDDADDCYISYASAPEEWRLDDGAAPPKRKPFARPTWDPGARTFRGSVEWGPTSFGGHRLWEYELTFAEDFCSIVGGRVVMDGAREVQFRAPWERTFRTLTYTKWTPDPATVFGSVFVQGTEWMEMHEGIASYHFDAEDDCYISYANAPSDWLLDDGTPPPAKKTFVRASYDAASRTFRGSIEWDPTFNQASRWVYEMVFSEDFSSIVAGMMREYGPSGDAVMRHTRFHDPREYQGIDDSVLVYVRRPPALLMMPRLRPP
uniref:RING-type domain-containing protein n=1 Tax=Zooxanthella nutricula TaxID=1333877 RepID=A0A7S2HRU7_9DINO